MKQFLIIFFIYSTIQIAYGQTGLLISEERYQKVPLLPAYSGVKYTEIPIKTSLKKFCPVPGNQGSSSTCVGWSIGYGAMTIQRAIQQQQTDQASITQNAFSAAFVYNQLLRDKSDCTEGVYLEDGLNLVKTYGDCLERSFKFDRSDCTAQPVDTHFVEAANNQVRDFATVFALNEGSKGKINKACKILATQTPIVIGMAVTKSFFEVLPGTEIWNPDVAESITGHHAMVLIGYNSVEKHFELMNSFGPSWGKNGFIRLPFDDFDRLCRFAYVMLPPEANIGIVSTNLMPPVTPPRTNEVYKLSGTFVFRQPAGTVTTSSDEDLIYYEEVGVIHDQVHPQLYRSIRPKFTVGDVFQLVAREIPQGRYVYVFSQGADGVVNRHFPRQNAGFILEQSVEIVIPGEESLLQISSAGEDNLCILYSFQPITDYEKRLAKVEPSSMPFHQKVLTAFQDVLISVQNIQYSQSKMSFAANAQPESGRIAVAMILGVVAE